MGSGPVDLELVALGAVSRPHGVRGELRVHRYNADSELMLALEEVTLRSEERSERKRVTRARMGPKGAVLLTLEGVGDREGADALRGFEVCVERDALPELDDEQWYHADLEGLAVVDGGGHELGRVEHVVTYPSIECLVVALNVDCAESVVEVPILEPWLVEVDLEAGWVRVSDLSDLPRRKP